MNREGLEKQPSEKQQRKRKRRSNPGASSPRLQALPLLSKFATERTLRDLHRAMEGKEFQSIEEANAFLKTLTGPGLKKALAKREKLTPKQQAQEFAYFAMEADDPEEI